MQWGGNRTAVSHNNVRDGMGRGLYGMKERKKVEGDLRNGILISVVAWKPTGERCLE